MLTNEANGPCLRWNSDFLSFDRCHLARFCSEIEPTFKVNDNLETFVSLGYVHTEFKDFNDLTYGNLSGLPFPEAPEWTVGHYRSASASAP